jgi:hypothetical protein
MDYPSVREKLVKEKGKECQRRFRTQDDRSHNSSKIPNPISWRRRDCFLSPAAETLLVGSGTAGANSWSQEVSRGYLRRTLRCSKLLFAGAGHGKVLDGGLGELVVRGGSLLLLLVRGGGLGELFVRYGRLG